MMETETLKSGPQAAEVGRAAVQAVSVKKPVPGGEAPVAAIARGMASPRPLIVGLTGWATTRGGEPILAD